MTFVKLAVIALMMSVLLVTFTNASDIPPEIQELYDQGKFDQAIEKAKEQMEKRKRAVEFPYFIATCYEKKLDFERAEEYYTKALDRKGSDLQTLYRLGKIIGKDSTRLEEAKEYFERGLQKARKDEEKALFEDGLGLYYLAKGDYKEANKQFRTAQYHDPTNCDYPMHLGDANYEKGAYASAITSYSTVLAECDSLNPEVHFRLGKSYVSQKKYNEALVGLGNAIRLDSSYVEAYRLRGKILILAALSSGDQEAALDMYFDAIWTFRRQIDFDYKIGEASYYLAKAFRALKYPDSAAVHYKHAVEEDYDKPDLYIELGLSYSKSKQYQKAVETLSIYENNVLADDPGHEWTQDEAELFLERARAYAGLKDSLSLAKAVDDFNMAWQLDSSDVSWLNDIGFNYYYLGKYDSTQYTKALEVFEMKITIDSTNFRSWLNAGYALMRMKDWERTAEYLKKVVEFDPENCTVKKMIASSLSQQKKYAESREYYSYWGECDTTTYEAEKWIGFTYLISKPADGKNAVSHLVKAFEQMKALGNDECHDPDLVTWIAQAYAIDKKYKSSDTWIKKGLRCSPSSNALLELKKSVDEALEEI
ncbi:MAG: tetratricopeptide repeat protein [candidate division Zixibacteria bacterium]|jgi:tetratricopeptide (TPR) repeat protein|nr:tetratricopeptide repeat protein [candidate division Zixibacteria bacterium]